MVKKKGGEDKGKGAPANPRRGSAEKVNSALNAVRSGLRLNKEQESDLDALLAPLIEQFGEESTKKIVDRFPSDAVPLLAAQAESDAKVEAMKKAMDKTDKRILKELKTLCHEQGENDTLLDNVLLHFVRSGIALWPESRQKQECFLDDVRSMIEAAEVQDKPAPRASESPTLRLTWSDAETRRGGNKPRGAGPRAK